ncbi:hypothetical protein EON66_05005 [archaeon]|nr:MAG: hypothetical protein EON66_05005 [archaeon]
MSGVLWYGTCLLGSLIWCLAHPSSAFLNSAELVAAAVVIGTVLPAYCTYLAAAAISSLGYVAPRLTCT